jgi:hypothetical protein
MSDWLMKVIRAEADRLLELAAEDDELRADLRALAERILAATQADDKGTRPSQPGDGPEETRSRSEDADEPLHELTLGRSRPSPPRAGPGTMTVAPINSGRDPGLPAIEARCRAKAAAARAVEQHQGDLARGSGFTGPGPSIDSELADWSVRLADGYYWLRASDETVESGLSVLAQVAGCFEAVAEALLLVRGEEGRTGALERGLQLVAEAQSALRRVLQRMNIADDPDQEDVYEWVRATAGRHRIFLKRFLRADDLADPEGWPSLLNRIDEAGSGGRMTPAQRALLDRIRLLREPIREGQGTDEDWSAIINAVDSLVAGGFPPSSAELRDIVTPILDVIPERDNLPRGFRLVLREVDRFLATRASAGTEETQPGSTAEVKAVARLLAEKSLVLIGGSRRRATEESLRRAFGLRSISWVETKEHQSVESFEPLVARPEVALVLLAIRWSSHAFGDVKIFCERHDKPLVRLPGGYSPNQVATQILSQCSEQLERRAAPIAPGDPG